MATQQQLRDQSTPGSNNWVIFWVVLALVGVAAVAYSMYKPNISNTTTTAGDVATTNDSVPTNASTLNNRASGDYSGANTNKPTSGAYVMPSSEAPANNSVSPNANNTGTQAQ